MAQRHRILIIEDDPGTLNLLEQIVRRAGYEPCLAREAQEGLERLRKEGADLLLLDLMMKNMDGWTLLEAIKADDHLRQVPVIIVSARHPKEDPVRTEAHVGMFEGYLVKPFEVNALIAKIREILASSEHPQQDSNLRPTA